MFLFLVVMVMLLVAVLLSLLLEVQYRSIPDCCKIYTRTLIFVTLIFACLFMLLIPKQYVKTTARSLGTGVSYLRR